jgi:putative ABC transport system permease protein
LNSLNQQSAMDRPQSAICNLQSAIVYGLGLRLTLTGLAIGAVAALLVSGGLPTMLYRIEPTDTVTYVVVSSVLLIVAGFACLLPALRAASVNPIHALRAA